MKKAVIYKTKYGAAEKYALWLADSLGCDVFRLDDIQKSILDDYELIIYGGGVHAGGIRGWDEFRKWLKPYLEEAYLKSVNAMDERALERGESIFAKPAQASGESAGAEGDKSNAKSSLYKVFKGFGGKSRELGQADYARGIDKTNTEEFRRDYHPKKQVIVFAVGMNVQNFDARAQLREVNFDRHWLRPLTCFYLDGAFDPKKVKGFDWKLINYVAKSIERSGLNASADDKQLLGYIRNGMDKVERSKLDPIIEEVRAIEAEGGAEASQTEESKAETEAL